MRGFRGERRARRARSGCTVALVVATALLVAACGGGGGSGEKSSSGDEPVTLTFPSWWWGEPGNSDWLKAVVAEFEKQHPNITVKSENVSFDDYGDRALAQISANKAPDVLHLTNLNMGDFTRVNALADLTDDLGDADITKDSFIPAQFEAPLTTDGKTRGVIHSVANYVPFYNERILKQAGYDEFPQDPDEFFAFLRKVADPPKRFGYAAAVAPGSPSELFIDASLWVFANGGDWARDGKPTIDLPENVQAIEELKRTVGSGVMPRGLDKATYRQLWWEGKVGVLFDGAWMKGFAEAESPKLADDFKTALLPWPSHRAATVYQIWAVPEGAKHKEEAFELISFMQNAANQRTMVSETKNISPRIGSVTEGFLEENPWFGPFQESAEKYGVSIIQGGIEQNAGEVVDAVAEEIEQVLYKDKPAGEALSEAQKRVEDVVAEG